MYIRVEVLAGARRTRLVKNMNDTYTAQLKEEAQGGRANLELRALIAKEFSVPITSVRIEKGHRARSKVIHIDNT